MTPQIWPNNQLGFTLLELLIAITIFSILSTITYSGLKTVLDTERTTRDHINHLSRLQISLNLIQRDIEQAVARQVRDEFGDTLPAMRSGGLSAMLLEFTHGGYPNPMGLKRSGLQRVAYQLEDDSLYRITWPTLDRAQETEPNKSILLEKINSAEFNFFDQQMKPHTEWPIKNEEQSEYPLPKAIEISLDLASMGQIRRLFRVAELVTK